ncbi:PREDICTED: uncharacterized protein LOC109157036 [Ipomoea nil]|uniref:uncharacterized protein LOC109157036 n=1 Tax=Ipomoea nil TaxID=35883 RepID=UPI000900F3F2|nr:PREDICTED: uncharacterized protein LOC109157036 [Ipomoea nil]
MGNDTKLVTDLLRRLSTTFKIRDLGTSSFFLGIETVTTDTGLILSQRRYMKDLLGRAGMTDCKPLATPAAVTKAVTPSEELFDNPTQYRRIVGALQYVTITRPDLSYAVNRLCQFMHSPTVDHWALVKRVLRYIKGTLDYGLCLTPSASTAYMPTPTLTGLGVRWIGRVRAGMQSFWVRISYLGYPRSNALLHVCQQKPNTKPLLMFPPRTKHVEIDYHFVRDKVASGNFLVNYVSTTDQLADVFTKPFQDRGLLLYGTSSMWRLSDLVLEGVC